MEIFSAKWCAPCKTLKAKINELGIAYEPVDIETDSGQQLARQRGVRGVPSIYDGKVLVTGLEPCMALLRGLNDKLS
jgi:glutaredoxin